MIRSSENNGVWELSLESQPCNEIGLALLSSLESHLNTIESKGGRVLIVHSGILRGFCAGADLRGLYAGIRGRAPDEYLPEVAEFLNRIHRVMDRLDQLPMVTIGALHGVCFGGGFELALTLDVLVADRTTRFGFPELRLGLIPGFGGIPRLRREVPNAVIRDLLFAGRSINAARAQALGFVSQLVARGEALSAARALAQQAASFDPQAAAAAKRFAKPIPLAELNEEKALFLELFARPVVVEALRAFSERTDVMPYLPHGESSP